MADDLNMAVERTERDLVITKQASAIYTALSHDNDHIVLYLELEDGEIAGIALTPAQAEYVMGAIRENIAIASGGSRG